ncbi:hypothetical protein BH09PSE5_BH09PSE5_37490 [soil metagenome]
MNVRALAIYLGGQSRRERIGVLFQYVLAPDVVTTRFQADDAFARDSAALLLSISTLAPTPEAQKSLWNDIAAPRLNGRFSGRNGWLLPPFFQNLLPEGVLRDRLAEIRGCEPNDNFEMLAACGRDLPGNLYALPIDLSRDELDGLVTQHHDALEMSVTASPMDEGVSVSGVQPKLGVVREGQRFVARTKDGDAQVIAKLPVVGYARLPELEELSLRLARAAGANVCNAYLVPLERLEVQHGYDLGEEDSQTNFLAVERYDRDAPGRVHCEDFAQVMSVWPEDKYTGATYLEVAATMLSLPTLGEPAVHELLRRIVVNELLGNPDMHLKNIGLRYPDGRTPELPGAYDIVAYAAYQKRHGHALHLLPSALRETPRARASDVATSKPQLTPSVVRQFATSLRLVEKPLSTVIRKTVAQAVATWPALIAGSLLTEQQKRNLLGHFDSHPKVVSLMARKA